MPGDPPKPDERKPREATSGGRTRRLRPRGSNQVGVRQFNERVVLQTLALHGSLAKAELARYTGLTAQTIALIVARLEKEDLVHHGEPVRGKVGQPAVPIILNASGAFAVGVRVGRRGLSTVLIDMTGQIRERLTERYAYPEPVELLDQIAAHLDRLRSMLGARQATRLVGVGVAAPFNLGGWGRLLGGSAASVEAWQRVDLQDEVQKLTALPVHFARDTNAACIAELVMGRGREIRSFLYLFVDTFIGGGVVIDSHLHWGIHGNAGAVGSMPIGGLDARRGASDQLLGQGSLWRLERLLADAGCDPLAAYDARALTPGPASITRQWARDAAATIATAITAGIAWLDVDTVVIDGSFDPALQTLLLEEVRGALLRHDWEGMWPPTVLAGTLGSDARALGGALLPLHAEFRPDRDLFLKQAGGL